MPKAPRAIRLLLVAAAMQATPAGARDAPETYWLGLVDVYGIRKFYPSEADLDAVQRVELARYGRGEIVPDVRTCGVSGRIIFGEAKSGWYVLAVPDSREERPDPEVFADREAWRARLAELGVPGEPSPVPPDILATTRPFRELNMREYWRFNGALGMTDDDWFCVGILILFVWTFGLNLAVPSWKTQLWTTVLLGGLAFLLAWQIPWDMGLAPFAYPIAVVILAWLGRALRGWWGPPTKDLMAIILSTPAREGVPDPGDGDETQSEPPSGTGKLIDGIGSTPPRDDDEDTKS